MTRLRGIPRRRLLHVGAAGLAASTLPRAQIHAAGTAGQLAVGLWDHWVPSGNAATRQIIESWAEKNNVEVRIDFITTVGNKLLLTSAAEAQARRGHDLLAFQTWMIHEHAERLEPVDDVMGRLIAQHGPVNDANTYLAKIGGTWRAVPATSGTQYKGSAARIDLLKQHAGIDVQAMYPAADRLGPGVDDWTYEGGFLAAAEKLHKAGYPFALPAGTFFDATDWIGAMFRAFGASLVAADGTITVRGNDKVRAVMDYVERLFQFIPPEMFAADDASNNRALISGRSALIFNPPSAWAVAKRDAPQVAEQVWHFPSPAGPEGRFVPFSTYYWGIWQFAQNTPAAKALLEHLSQRDAVAKMVAASDGYDIPPFATLTDLDTWSVVGPPRGTVFNYPVKPHHKAEASIAYAPAPANVAVQMYTSGIAAKMIARRVQNNDPLDAVLAWAEQELEGFNRG